VQHLGETGNKRQRNQKSGLKSNPGAKQPVSIILAANDTSGKD